MKKLFASLLVLMASGCPDVKVDENEVGGGGPTVEFDPARSLATGARFIPFPNDLARSPTTGKLNLGAPQCPETPTAKATRENVLNSLDGFGTYQVAMQVTFTAPVDPASIVVDPMSPDVNVVMYQVANAGAPLDPTTAMPIPIIARPPGTTLRQLPDDCANPEVVNAVVFVPTIPLRQKSTYIVALKKGIKDTDGNAFQGSYTWGLVSAVQEPVTLDEAGDVVSDRTPLDPADDDDRTSLLALAQLYAGHKPALAFLDATPLGPTTRGDLLVAFAFTTQTTTDQLDPTVPTSPAGMLSAAGFLAPFASITAALNPPAFPPGPTGTGNCGTEATTDPHLCFLKLALGGCKPYTTGCTTTHYLIGNSLCQTKGSAPTPAVAGIPPGTYDCAAVGGVLVSALSTQNYQAQIANPLAASPGVTVGAIQGAWSDPVNPTSTGALTLQTLATIPATAAPADGYPVVIFGHGLTGSKENLFAVAGILSKMGFATVAIDFSQHGSRLSRTSTSVLLGCKGHCFNGTTDTGTECETIQQCGAGETCGSAPIGGTASFVPPNGTDAAQCYTPIFTGDLANTRDNFRQSVLDIERLVKAVKTCTGSTCGAFSIDPTRIYYGGTFLGSMLGTIAVAMTSDIKAAALNVSGAGWLDIIENTDSVTLRCSLVNALIDAGVLTGTKWAGGTTGLCLEGNGMAWKTQPGYATFSTIARWVLDPADPANFSTRLRMKPHLIQEVVGDAILPNISTQRQAALTGAAANLGVSGPYAGPTAASAAISTNPTQSKFITYTSDANHLFAHPSLLKPAATSAAGFAGTWRMQIDFAQYLDNNDAAFTMDTGDDD